MIEAAGLPTAVVMKDGGGGGGGGGLMHHPTGLFKLTSVHKFSKLNM